MDKLNLEAGDKVLLCSSRPLFWNGRGAMDYLLDKIVTVSDILPTGSFAIKEDDRWIFEVENVVEVIPEWRIAICDEYSDKIPKRKEER